MTMPDETFDALVLGAGMAGLTAAARAAAAGQRVLLVEKAADIGGSAIISGGIVWAPDTVAAYREFDAESDEALIGLNVDNMARGLAWMAQLDVGVSEPFRLDHVLHFPSMARRFDNHAYLHRCKQLVEKAGGHLLLGASAAELVIGNGAVTGARIVDRDGESVVRAPWTVLATGGFQGSAELRERYLGAGTRDLILRANRTSIGDGLRLAVSAGGTVAADTDRFYGNLLPAGLSRPFEDRDWLRLSQYHSIHSILLGHDGGRIGDESIAYYENAFLTSRTPDGRALLVGDERVREEGMQVNDGLDRVAEAASEGCHVVYGQTPDELEAQATRWGYRNVAWALARFNAQMADGDRDGTGEPGRTYNRVPLTRPPFFAVEVRPAITFPFAGLSINAGTQVLRASGEPVAGLLAAGVDAHVYARVYGGGLGFALATGLRAADMIVG
jgi:succinate dehydrogenase/fumarate reductase flavoprotein subunit